MKVVEPEKKYDFWFKNGHVVDPSQNIDQICDVLVKGSRIAAAPENGVVDPADVKETVECSGYYVFPGLIDHHAHFSWNHTLIGVEPDLYTLPSGVTSACDAGSMGSSGFAADEMEMRFMRIGVNIYSVQDSDLMRMRAVFQNKTSVIIGISVGGEAQDVLYLLRESHNNGARTILMTARNHERYEEFCNEIVLIPSLEHLNHGNVISPQFPILVMIDVIYSYYVEQDRFAKKTWHNDTLKALKGKKI